ncbi:MAG: ABC transporter substrate-binding protein [Bradyrhizobiaceae bacterium]|nr:ABC transporter substrate-binding protein [Bradyrhizobiaceae bacterium]
MRKQLVGFCAVGALLAATGIASAETVKVGVISTFSGGFARWGEQMKRGIEIYQKHHGDSVKGNKIEIVYRDDTGPVPDKARQLAEELILREKVQFIAGFPWSPNALAVADVVTEAKVPTIIWNAATGVITRRSPYFVRTSFTLPQVAYPMGVWAGKNGVKTAITAITEFAPGVDAETFFIKAFKENGGQVLESIRMPLSTTDFSPFFERILNAKPDALFMFGPGGPSSQGIIATWASRLRPAGIKLLATNEIQEIDLVGVGKNGIGAISTGHYTETNDNELNKRMWADMKAMYGEKAIADIAMVATYDGMEMIYRVVEKLGPRAKPEDIMQMMSNMSFPSPRGRLVIDPKERDVVNDVDIRKVDESGGRVTNVAFDKVPSVKDPWKEANPAK